MRAARRVEVPSGRTDDWRYNSYMATTVGVRDLKNALSRWLRLVRTGESVIVVDRGQPVAILSPIVGAAKSRTVEEHLASLAARGLVTLGNGKRIAVLRRLPKGNLSGAISEDRDERA